MMNIGIIERKVLDALLVLADENNKVQATIQTIAETMGYKTAGGAITFALKALERENYIIKHEKGRYELLI